MKIMKRTIIILFGLLLIMFIMVPEQRGLRTHNKVSYDLNHDSTEDELFIGPSFGNGPSRYALWYRLGEDKASTRQNHLYRGAHIPPESMVSGSRLAIQERGSESVLVINKPLEGSVKDTTYEIMTLP